MIYRAVSASEYKRARCLSRSFFLDVHGLLSMDTRMQFQLGFDVLPQNYGIPFLMPKLFSQTLPICPNQTQKIWSLISPPLLQRFNSEALRGSDRDVC